MLLDLPTVPLPDWVAGVRLLGPITHEALLAGLYDGLRLATIVICIGAANSLANPKRLLTSVPPALYEIGTALVVAVTVLPPARRQRPPGARRPGAARRDADGRVGRLRRFLVPVLEDALERSLALAAGMDARGYGRAGTAPRAAERWLPALLLLGGLCGIGVGTYAVLDSTAPRWLAAPMLRRSASSSRSSGWSAPGRRVQRSRYRPDPWRLAEVTVVALSGLAVGVGGVVDRPARAAGGLPGASTSMPYLSVLALAGRPVGLLPAVAAPPPRRARARPGAGGGRMIELRGHPLRVRRRGARPATAST